MKGVRICELSKVELLASMVPGEYRDEKLRRAGFDLAQPFSTVTNPDGSWTFRQATDTVELDKMLAAKPETQPAGEFVEWLQGRGLLLGQWEGERFVPAVGHTLEELLAEWKGIDLAECERERRELLEKPARENTK